MPKIAWKRVDEAIEVTWSIDLKFLVERCIYGTRGPVASGKALHYTTIQENPPICENLNWFSHYRRVMQHGRFASKAFTGFLGES